MLINNLLVGGGAKLLSLALPFLLLALLNRRLAPEDFAIWLIIQQYMRAFQSFDFSGVSVVTRIMAVYHLQRFQFSNIGRSAFRSIRRIMVAFGVPAGLAAGAVIFISLDRAYGSIALGAFFFVLATFAAKATKGLSTASRQFFLLDLQVLSASVVGVLGVYLFAGGHVESVFFSYFAAIFLVELLFFVFLTHKTAWEHARSDADAEGKGFTLSDIFKYMGFGALTSMSSSVQRILFTFVISRDLSASDVAKVSIPLLLITSYAALINFSARFATQVFARLSDDAFAAHGRVLFYKYQFLALLASTAGFAAAYLGLPPVLPLWLPQLDPGQRSAVLTLSLTLVIFFNITATANLSRNILISRGDVAAASIFDFVSTLAIPVALVAALTVDAPLLIYAYVATQALRLLSEALRLSRLLGLMPIIISLALIGGQIAALYALWTVDRPLLFAVLCAGLIAVLFLLALRWNKDL